MPRSPRKRLGEGIYRDATGLSAVVGVRDRQREKRFPFGTPLEELRAWRKRTRVDLEAIAPRATRGTLAADIEAYLRQIKALTSARTRTSELKAWAAKFGKVPRSRLTPAIVRETMGVWADAGVAPKTINNRVQSLATMWRALDGARAMTPCDEITALHVERTPPVAVSPATIRRVATALARREKDGWLPTAKTRARFMVLAACGRRPSELMRAQPEDVDLTRRVWVVRDGKGGWSPGVYLNDDMVAAWQVFIAAQAWGPYNTSSFAEALREAGWPTGVRPYQLRHSVGISLSEAGVDLADVQAHMGHARIATTRKFYVPVLGARLEAAGRAIEGRIGWKPKGRKTTRHAPARGRRKAS
jgi:integrase